MTPNNATCFHCGLFANGHSACHGMVAGEDHVFCCSGCLNVCQVIHDAGLSGFYDRLKKNEATLSPPPDAPADLEQYTLDEVQQEVTRVMGDGTRQARLMVEGIHCAACAWLIEHALNDMDGVLKAEVNLAHHWLLLNWQPQAIALQTIIKRLSLLGYSAIPFNLDALSGSMRDENRRLLFRLGFAGFGTMNMMWISIALYAGAFSGIGDEYRQYFYWVSLAIATPVLIYSGGPILISAWRGLRYARLSMDLPISIGLLASYAYSLWQILQGGVHVYFDTVVTFLFIILIGRYLEAMARKKAASATWHLLELQPRLALRLTDSGEERVSVRQLSIGDRLRIKPGDKVPADGRVLEGESYIDESMLTGEAKPVHKLVGSCIASGTLNGEGPLTMQVEQTGEGTVLSRIIHIVETAQGSKARVQRLVDMIVPWFVAITIALSVGTFLYWWHNAEFNTALLAATAVLIITCPCALGLSTPMAIAVSSGLAAQKGVLIRNGEALERLSAVTHVVLDKTGTLTSGKMSITDVISYTPQVDILQLAGAVERHFSHPLSLSICSAVEKTGLGFPDCLSPKAIPGLGVSGIVGGEWVWVGSMKLMEQMRFPLSAELREKSRHIESEMGIPIAVARQGKILGLLHIEDQIRDGTIGLIDFLGQRGLGMTLLTGDSFLAASYLQARLPRNSNASIQVIAGVLPEDKAREINALQQRGEHVLMVGDGINDAPALASSDVSIAMGSGTDVSMECSDVVLMGSDLNRIPWTLELARATLSTIRQNLKLSLAYNILLVPAAMAAWVTPIFAALAMPISSLLVIGNAILIRRKMRLQSRTLKQSETIEP